MVYSFDITTLTVGLLLLLGYWLAVRKTRSRRCKREHMTVLVTGGASGLGKGIVDVLVAQGHQVYTIDKIPNIFPSTVQYLRVDLSNPKCVHTIQQWINTADVVICNAGVFEFDSILNLDEERINAVWQTNVFGVWRTVKACKPKHHLVIVSSEAAILARSPFTWPYVGSKRAGEDLADCFRVENPEIHVTVVRPGAMRTSMLDKLFRLHSDSPRITFMWRIAQLAAQFWSSNEKDVAEAIAEEVSRLHPRNVLNLGHNPVLRLFSCLPDFVTSWSIKTVLYFVD